MGYNCLINKEDAIIVEIDVQERLLPVMDNSESVASRCEILLKGAAEVEVPVIVTEQYPRGLGHTVPEILAAAGEKSPVIEKTTFSCAAESAFMKALEESGRRKVIICGIEAHVCVCQTALELIDLDYEVYIAADATSSRNAINCKLALERMAAAGAEIVPVESVLFEFLRDAKHEKFKAISALVK